MWARPRRCHRVLTEQPHRRPCHEPGHRSDRHHRTAPHRRPCQRGRQGPRPHPQPAGRRPGAPAAPDGRPASAAAPWPGDPRSPGSTTPSWPWRCWPPPAPWPPHGWSHPAAHPPATGPSSPTDRQALPRRLQGVPMTFSPSHPTTMSIPGLRAALNGQVIAPGDAAYDQARTVFFGGIDRRPAVIVRVADTSAVAQVVSLARETGLELAIRGGGHSPAGHSVTDGGIVLDLSQLRALHLDPGRHVAWAQTGLTAGQYITAAGAHGLATGFGDTGSVGIGGITLAGGIGYLVRKHGLTIDDLLAAEVVTADGRLLRADAETHPDLFWAIRGGGGNFGVATRFRFRLHEVSTIVGGVLMLPATADVIASFVAESEAAPEELSTIANIMPAPPLPFVPAEQHGRLVVMAMLVYAGDPDAGLRAVAPFRALAAPIADMVRPMR